MTNNASRILGLAIALPAALATATAGMAQDLPTTQIPDHGDVVLRSALTRSMLERSRGNVKNTPAGTKARAKAKCAAARRAAASGRADPTLIGMCDRAGYR